MFAFHDGPTDRKAHFSTRKVNEIQERPRHVGMGETQRTQDVNGADFILNSYSPDVASDVISGVVSKGIEGHNVAEFHCCSS